MATKASNRRSSRTAPENQDTVEKPDQLLTLVEWKRLPLETLRLKCTSNMLPGKGKKQEMALRLFQHFHPDGVRNVRNRNKQRKRDKGDNAAVRNNNNPDDLPPPPPEIIRADDEPADVTETNQTDDTLAYDGDDTEDNSNNDNDGRLRRNLTPPPQEPIDVSNIDDVVQKAVDASIATAIASALQPVLEEMTVSRERAQLAEDECRALRSQIESSRAGHTGMNSSLSTVTTSTAPTTAVSVSRSTPVTAVTPAPTRSGSSTAPVLNDFSTHVTSSSLLPIKKKNPFPLPGFLQKYLLIIEKGEYLDFEKIKPKRIDQSRRDEESEQGFGVAMTTHFDSDIGEETLRLKKVSTNKIETFPEWLECWNKFLSARLHYQPDEHALLMAYQKQITSYAKKYKFFAVYGYDVEFRKTMAAERSLDDEERTAFWNHQHEFIKNEYLAVEHLLAPRTCFKCKEKGHMSGSCPNKNKKFSGNRQNFNGARSSGVRFPPGPPPPPPPPPQPPQPFPFQPFQQFQSPYGNPTTYYQPGPVGPPTGSNNQGGGKSKSCNGFNHNGYCWRGPTCHFPHVCNRCGSNAHGGINCDNNTSTGFYPAQSGFRPRF